MIELYNVEVVTNNGKTEGLNKYKGKVLLIVNVASLCGFTKQYSELEELYQKLSERGLEVLAFPCNQFGNQEPGDSEEIKEFCNINYSISFPIFEKVEVNGKNAHPLYNLIKQEAKGLLGSTAIKWNFTKFLVDREGSIIKRFSPSSSPMSLLSEVEKYL